MQRTSQETNRALSNLAERFSLTMPVTGIAIKLIHVRLAKALARRAADHSGWREAPSVELVEIFKGQGSDITDVAHS